jgi:hypothetical protein
MRYITVPFCWLDEEQRVLSTSLRINPFSIDAYHSSVLDYMHPVEDIPLSQDITIVCTRAGVTYEVMLTVKKFEQMLDNFMNQ